MKATSLCSILLLALIASCRKAEVRKDYILTERNLIPEGVAFDHRTNTIYIGSTFKRKIVQITDDGSVSDFISEKADGVFSIVGMEVDEDRGILWANTAHANGVMPLVDPHPTEDWMTNITSFDIEQKKQIKQYALSGKGFLNDVTILPSGDVFATDTYNNKIYKIDAKVDSLQLFLAPEGFTFLNGITFSAKHKSLFVSCTEGIFKIDPETKAYKLLSVPDGMDVGTIDGLTFHENYLIGHQSKIVSRFYLNEGADAIINAELLDSGKEFDSSTTGEVGEGFYYFIVNSQIRSGIDKTKASIKPIDSLNDIIIRKIKL